MKSRFPFIILFIISSIILSSCNFGEKKEINFSNLYSGVISGQIEQIRTTAKNLGYLDSYTSAGGIQGMIDIPTIISGALSSTYDAKVRGPEGEVHFKNLSFQYETLLGSGSLSVKDFSLISQATDLFFRFNEVSSFGLLPEGSNEVFARYKDNWLKITQSDLESTLSGATEDELLTYQINQAISRLTLKEIESYFITYPLFQEKASLGNRDGLESYEVVLAKENIVAFFDAFSLKATGKSMTPEAKSELMTSMKDFDIRGVLAFDSQDNSVFTFSGSIQGAGSAEALPLEISMKKDVSSIKIGGPSMLFHYTQKNVPEGADIDGKVVANGEDLATLKGLIKKKGDNWIGLNLTFDAPQQGVSVKLTHDYDDAKKSFEGKIDAGFGNLSWDGSSGTDGLKTLNLNGAVIGSSLTMNLSAGSDGILTGPLMLRSGDTILASATLGLKIHSERLYLSVEIPNPQDPQIVSKARIDISGDRKPWEGTIESPKDAKNFQDFANELSRVLEPTLLEEALDLPTPGNQTPPNQILTGTIIQ